jgi:PilZ domain
MMVKRRSLTPATHSHAGDVHATRRGSGGARREAADRVLLRNGDVELTGWALNISRGGIRVILEDTVELGQEFDVEIGLEQSSSQKRRGRVVWVQEEHDGMIAGVEFIDARGGGSQCDTPSAVRKSIS